NSTVTLIIDGNAVDVPVDAGGNWTYTPASPLGDGAHAISAVATDAAGNASTPATGSLLGDSIAPDVAVSGAGTDAGDRIAFGSSGNDATPTVSGTAEAGSVVNIYVDDTLVGTTTALADGSWSVTPAAALADGAHTVTATATDAMGNVSAPTDPVTLT